MSSLLVAANVNLLTVAVVICSNHSTDLQHFQVIGICFNRPY